MPDYHARLIPHLKGPHRDLALRKQNLGLYDDLSIREAGKFLNGYDMAASKEIAPHFVLPIYPPRRDHGGPLLCLLSGFGIYSGSGVSDARPRPIAAMIVAVSSSVLVHNRNGAASMPGLEHFLVIV